VIHAMTALSAALRKTTGVTPVKKSKDRTTGATRIWKRIQDLGEATKPKAAQLPKPKRRTYGQRWHTAQETTAQSEGSKTAQVVTKLQRKKGATLAEIMEKMGWQRHTVRGFMAGTMKKAGFTVESFKPEGVERTYRINK
jgi:hypothetical protein